LFRINIYAYQKFKNNQIFLMKKLLLFCTFSLAIFWASACHAQVGYESNVALTQVDGTHAGANIALVSGKVLCEA